jgi:hypothetical protein
MSIILLLLSVTDASALLAAVGDDKFDDSDSSDIRRQSTEKLFLSPLAPQHPPLGVLMVEESVEGNDDQHTTKVGSDIATNATETQKEKRNLMVILERSFFIVSSRRIDVLIGRT